MKINCFLFIVVYCFLVSCGQGKKSLPDPPEPSGNCTYSRDEKNPMGKRIRVMQEEKFMVFDWEDSASKNYFNGDDFIKGYLSCVSVDTVQGIYFDFLIRSEDAFRYYGTIKRGNTVTFILKSGKAVEVSFGNTFSGSTNLSKETTEYSALAPLSPSKAQQLLSEELQKVRISWSKKEEYYTVVNPRIFINQLPCVK